MNARRPAWREPMVWLLLAIPAGTVVAGVETMRLAGGGMDADPDAVRRTLQAQVADLAPDEHAARLGLRAVVHVDADGRVRVALPVAATPRPRTLRFVHATRADGDRAWTGTATGTWRGPVVDPRTRGRWILEDAVDGWRLVGAGIDEGGGIALEPAVGAR